MPFRQVHNVGGRALALRGAPRGLHLPLVTDRHLAGLAVGSNLSIESAALVEVAFVASFADTADGTTRVWTNADIGAADANRKVVVVIMTGESTSHTFGGTNTIAGDALTLEAESTEQVGPNAVGCAILSRDVPTGTTATISIAVQSSGTINRSVIATYRVINAAADKSDSGTSVGESSGVQTTTLTIPAGGVCVSGATTEFNATAMAWNILDEGHEDSVENVFCSSAAKFFATLQTEVAVTATETGGTNAQDCMATVAWEAA